MNKMHQEITETFLFDTYAIMEILEKNEAYEIYLDADIIINDFIFAELCYNLTKEKHPNLKEILDKYAQHISYAEPETIRKAMEFRLNWKDRNVSITDCIGYVMAKDLGIKFLTGDKEFENIENVEFVK
ncbi:PIN domain-containing protein [Candidatus Pacearchaeota archaeon]|nr:PIN domain-containing protein [Candidatus Pacearchaeota archaeon]